MGMAHEFAVKGVVLAIMLTGSGHCHGGMDAYGNALGDPYRMDSHAIDVGHGC